MPNGMSPSLAAMHTGNFIDLDALLMIVEPVQDTMDPGSGGLELWNRQVLRGAKSVLIESVNERSH